MNSARSASERRRRRARRPASSAGSGASETTITAQCGWPPPGTARSRLRDELVAAGALADAPRQVLQLFDRVFHESLLGRSGRPAPAGRSGAWS